VVDDCSYGKDVVLLPPRVISPWWRLEGHELTIDDLRAALEYGPELLIVGTGVYARLRVSDAVRAAPELAGLRIEVLPTKEACRRFNALAAEGCKVAAALHLTC